MKIYDFHYNFIKKSFDAELSFTDTDSLIYKIKSENVYEELFKRKDLFDFSNCSKDSRFFDGTNNKVVGKMKDGFVGLKSKIYSIKKIDGKEHNTAKWEVLQLNLINLKMFYLIKKLLDGKWKEFKVKNIN